MVQGLVFDIQRFSIHDGPGIRTTVFLKGCPLRCLWCHNPEGQRALPEIFFSPEKCIACHYCELVCQQGAHIFDGDNHIYNREVCITCGECTRECYAQALEISGKTMTVQEVIGVVLKDRAFYEASGGGMTLSGGEPMQQYPFALALVQSARSEGLHTCIETSGFSLTEHYLEISPYVSQFYFDIKETDPDKHLRYTGVSSRAILENLTALDLAGAEIILRCPVIPGLNDRPDHFREVAAIANRLQQVHEIHVLPYHALGTSKNKRLSKPEPMEVIKMPETAQVEGWVAAVQAQTGVPVRRG